MPRQARVSSRSCKHYFRTILPPPGFGSGYCWLGLIAPAVAASENANVNKIAIFLNM